MQGWIDDPKTLPGTHGIPEPADFALALRARQIKARLFPTTNQRMEQVCHDFVDAAEEKWRERGAAALSEKERFALAVETFYGEVNNGGLGQYLGGERGATANWAADAFLAIGIPELAGVMREVTSLFPGGGVPEDSDGRWD